MLSMLLGQDSENVMDPGGRGRPTQQGLPIVVWFELCRPAELLLHQWYPFARCQMIQLSLNAPRVQILVDAGCECEYSDTTAGSITLDDGYHYASPLAVGVYEILDNLIEDMPWLREFSRRADQRSNDPGSEQICEHNRINRISVRIRLWRNTDIRFSSHYINADGPDCVLALLHNAPAA